MEIRTLDGVVALGAPTAPVSQVSSESSPSPSKSEETYAILSCRYSGGRCDLSRISVRVDVVVVVLWFCCAGVFIRDTIVRELAARKSPLSDALLLD